MADKKRSKSTGETPKQQRKKSKSIAKILKENVKASLKKRPRNTVEKYKMGQRKK